MMGGGEQGLSGSWTHSFEEDVGADMVYRPSGTFAFPVGRRPRDTLDFSMPGQVTTGAPGPDDRLQRSTTSLTPLGMNRFRIGDGREIEVVEVRSDILKVRSA
ncbi:hypothetical protein Q4S45_18945 [Massilia sp. R2A-15]|uniref:hypothetical protein n=1 Tax=Massilia sp. R2A-15 TaxID=3064278 RepID=UPI002733A393|nr:hypothetical protein [Massilia sp. R2A-15]WLI88770.1 hypothetical protein Q4S45_18945 [Massilia sp. R2A-15]